MHPNDDALRLASALLCLATLTSGAATTAVARTQESVLPFRVDADGAGAGPVAVRAEHGQAVQFELALESLVADGATLDVELDAFFTGPDGKLLPIGIGCTPSPFNAAHTRREQEVVVALRNTTNELRVFEILNGALIQRHAADLPTRIEALDLGDADNDGLIDIVVGLDQFGTNHLRIFRHDPATGFLQQQAISGTLAQHIESLDIGDADNDGDNEIVIGLERTSTGQPATLTHVLMYSFENGAWVGPTLISTPEAVSVQQVAIGDPDNDGVNEVAVLLAEITTLPASIRQVRLYEWDGAGWVREDVTPAATTGPLRAERLIIADADSDGLNEMVTSNYGTGPGNLMLIQQNAAGAWTESFIATAGLVDALDAGDFDHDGTIDVVAGVFGESPASEVRAYERVNETWVMTPVSGNSANGQTVWDVALGDARNEGCDVVLAADDFNLRMYEAGSTTPAGGLAFNVLIDSVQIGDIDNDALASTVKVHLGPFESARVPFRLRVDAPPGTDWDLVFEAKAVMRSGDGVAKNYRVLAPAVRVEVAR